MVLAGIARVAASNVLAYEAYFEDVLDPNGDGAVKWPRYRNDTKLLLMLNVGKPVFNLMVDTRKDAIAATQPHGVHWGTRNALLHAGFCIPQGLRVARHNTQDQYNRSLRRSLNIGASHGSRVSTSQSFQVLRISTIVAVSAVFRYAVVVVRSQCANCLVSPQYECIQCDDQRPRAVGPSCFTLRGESMY